MVNQEIVLEYVRGDRYDNAHTWFVEDCDVNFFASGLHEQPEDEPATEAERNDPYYMDYFDVWPPWMDDDDDDDDWYINADQGCWRCEGGIGGLCDVCMETEYAYY